MHQHAHVVAGVALRLGRDRERLAEARYVSQYIPLFARPGLDGRSSGKRTTNSAPRPGPALRAVTLPPCSSTKPFTSASPIPKPVSDRSSVRSACVNGSKMTGRSCGAIPAPSSATTIVALRYQLEYEKDPSSGARRFTASSKGSGSMTTASTQT